MPIHFYLQGVAVVSYGVENDLRRIPSVPRPWDTGDKAQFFKGSEPRQEALEHVRNKVHVF